MLQSGVASKILIAKSKLIDVLLSEQDLKGCCEKAISFVCTELRADIGFLSLFARTCGQESTVLSTFASIPRLCPKTQHCTHNSPFSVVELEERKWLSADIPDMNLSTVMLPLLLKNQQELSGVLMVAFKVGLSLSF